MRKLRPILRRHDSRFHSRAKIIKRTIRQTTNSVRVPLPNKDNTIPKSRAKMRWLKLRALRWRPCFHYTHTINFIRKSFCFLRKKKPFFSTATRHTSLLPISSKKFNLVYCWKKKRSIAEYCDEINSLT